MRVRFVNENFEPPGDSGEVRALAVRSIHRGISTARHKCSRHPPVKARCLCD